DIKNVVTNRFAEMKDNAIRGVQKMYDRTSELFNKVKTYASNTLDNMGKGAKELPGRIGSAIKNMAHKAVDGVSSMGKSLSNRLGSVVNGVVNGLNKRSEEHTSELQSRFEIVCCLQLHTTLYARHAFPTRRSSDLVKTYASNTFDHMVKGAKELPGRIGSAIKNMAHKAVDGVSSMGKSLSNRLGSVVNGVVNGLNK